MNQRIPIDAEARCGRWLNARSRRAELLILCARIGFNPPT